MGPKVDLIAALSAGIPAVLSEHLVTEFEQVRRDCMTGTLGRSSPGKFIETVVQVLQHLESGNYDPAPSVDAYLKNLESRSTTLDDDLRLSLARIARSMYTMRNKRNIAHKGAVEPNIYDLQFLYAGAQWILSELVRKVLLTDVIAANRIISQVQAPAGPFVEHRNGKPHVMVHVPLRDELLLLLYSVYPEEMHVADLCTTIRGKASGSVKNALLKMYNDRLVHRAAGRYSLTQIGVPLAMAVQSK